MIRVVEGAPTPYSVRQLKADHPDTSFPRNLSDELLAGYDVFRVQRTTPPETGPDERAVLGDPELQDGLWAQTWVVETLTQEELDQRAHNQREAARGETERTLTQRIARDRAAEIVRDDSTPFEEVVSLAPIFDDWEVGIDVEVGQLLYYNGTVVEVLQAHTTQADWQPPDVPALYMVWRDPDVATPWTQPAGAQDAYALGVEVTHQGRLWISEVADNVWEPGIYGWGDIGPAEEA